MNKEKRIGLGLFIVRVALGLPLVVFAINNLLPGTNAWASTAALVNFLKLSIPLHVLGLTLLIIELLTGLMLITGFGSTIAAILGALIYVLYCLSYHHQGYTILTLQSIAIIGTLIGLMLTGSGNIIIKLFTIKKKSE